MFTTKESYVEWLVGTIDGIRNNGLKEANRAYEAALCGKGKESWLNMNNITDIESREREWAKHICFLKDQITYLEKKIKKYQREVAKNI